MDKKGLNSKTQVNKTGKVAAKKQPVGATKASNTQPKIAKEHMIGDSIDREIQNVDSNLFQSQVQTNNKYDSNLGQVSNSIDTVPKNYLGATAGKGVAGITQTRNTSKRDQYRQQMNSVGANIDDSEFYRSTNMIDNTKDTLVETNIRSVLEKHMASNGDHKPCKVPDRLYEKLPMQKEGIYLKDFKPQDLHMSKPHYGDANNPYENFIPQHPPATDNSLYRRDFTTKQMKNLGEPIIRDVVSSQHDFAKHLRAPNVNDTMYKVVFMINIG
jgi:hypothetical protein